MYRPSLQTASPPCLTYPCEHVKGQTLPEATSVHMAKVPPRTSPPMIGGPRQLRGGAVGKGVGTVVGRLMVGLVVCPVSAIRTDPPVSSARVAVGRHSGYREYLPSTQMASSPTLENPGLQVRGQRVPLSSREQSAKAPLRFGVLTGAGGPKHCFLVSLQVGTET